MAAERRCETFTLADPTGGGLRSTVQTDRWLNSAAEMSCTALQWRIFRVFIASLCHLRRRTGVLVVGGVSQVDRQVPRRHQWLQQIVHTLYQCASALAVMFIDNAWRLLCYRHLSHGPKLLLIIVMFLQSCKMFSEHSCHLKKKTIEMMKMFCNVLFTISAYNDCFLVGFGLQGSSSYVCRNTWFNLTAMFGGLSRRAR